LRKPRYASEGFAAYGGFGGDPSPPGESEISSEAIGEIVMEHLRELDDVAYVRFASVYRNFREAKDFRAALDELSGDDDGRPAASARK
jgi:hypothetical protein